MSDVQTGQVVTDWQDRAWTVVGVADQTEARPYGTDRMIVLRDRRGALAQGWAGDIGTDLGLPYRPGG